MPNGNLLPYDGSVYYNAQFLDTKVAQELFKQLVHEINWHNDVVKIFGKTHIMARKMAWMAEKDYPYGGDLKKAQAWHEAVLDLKKRVEWFCQTPFDACLLNLYHNGHEAMGYHSDDEKEIAPNSSIASVSLGATRRFVFQHKKSKEKVACMLENGSLLEMKGSCQSHWKHALPKMLGVNEPRINITFRKLSGW